MKAGRWLWMLPRRWRARIETSPTLRKVVPNTGWLAGDKLLRMGLGVIVGVMVARALGPASYGRLNFAMALAALFSPLATLGLERIVVRELVKRPDAAGEVLGSALRLRLVGGVVAWLLASAGVAWLRPGDGVALALVAVLAAAFVPQALEVVDLWYQSQVRSRDAVLAVVAAFLVAAGIKVALVFLHAPLVAFGAAWFADSALAAVALAWVYARREGGFAAWRATRQRTAQLLRDGWPLILSGVMILIYLRIDQVMLGQMADPEELGIYSVAVKLVEVWYFVPTAVVASAFPAIVEAKKLNEVLFYRRLQRLYNAMALLGYLIALPTTLLAGPVVGALFGPAYADAAPMVAVLVWSVMFTNLGVARSAFLTSMNWNQAYFVTVALGGIVNIVLNLALIPLWGGMGAVVASCVAYWLAAHGSCYLYRPLWRTGNMLTKALVWPVP